LLSHGWWLSPGTPSSSTTKTGHHDIAEILLKVALNTNNSIQFYLKNKKADKNHFPPRRTSLKVVFTVAY
jgi:hypothetical protein